MNLTKDRVMELFEYNPVDGKFTRKTNRGPSKKGSVAGCVNKQGYSVIMIDGKLYYGHRLAWFVTYGVWPECQIDHINMSRSDNRIENLREADHSQNKCNKPKGPSNTSGYKGVGWSKQKGKWRARINYENKEIHIGFFSDPYLAHLAYEKYAISIHKEFARTK